MSSTTTANAYGIGIMTMIVALTASIIFYQSFYLPESLQKPTVDDHILHPTNVRNIDMIVGSDREDQTDNFIPKIVAIQLGVDNMVRWTNLDATAHTVTPDDITVDSYSGDFGSLGVIRAGDIYEFLFTEARVIPYHCDPHPWMTGTLDITRQRF